MSCGMGNNLRLFNPVLLTKCVVMERNFSNMALKEEKKEEIGPSPMIKTPTPTE